MGRGRGAGFGRGASTKPNPAAKPTAANPLEFIPGFAERQASGPSRGNPDPFAFGAARPSAAQLQAQNEEELLGYNDKIYGVKDLDRQDEVHLFVLDELKKMVGKCRVQDIPPPPGADEAIQALKVAVVSSEAQKLFCCCLWPWKQLWYLYSSI